MIRKSKKGLSARRVIILGCLFLVFFFTAKEDRRYKNWKMTYLSLFSSYFEVRNVTSVILSPGENLLTDVSGLATYTSPFRSRFMGKIRKSLYSRLSPRMEEYSRRLDPEGRHYLVETLVHQKGPQFTEALQPEGRKIQSEDLLGLREFMEQNEINYILFPYDNWWAKRREAKSAGLRLLHANKHYMLCTSKNERRR
jgi:hypothetical protein